MKQLRLFGHPPVDLLAKLVRERKEGIKVNCHFNGEALFRRGHS
jgi:hypothetical protein